MKSKSASASSKGMQLQETLEEVHTPELKDKGPGQDMETIKSKKTAVTKGLTSGKTGATTLDSSNMNFDPT